jgi:hypothetical protein
MMVLRPAMVGCGFTDYGRVLRAVCRLQAQLCRCDRKGVEVGNMPTDY